GVAEGLRRKRAGVRVVAVEPAEPAVLSGGKTGVHKIEGVGAGFIVPLWEPGVVDEIMPVSTDEAKAMARRLAREEALLAGTSTGANIVAALRLAGRVGAGPAIAPPF